LADVGGTRGLGGVPAVRTRFELGAMFGDFQP